MTTASIALGLALLASATAANAEIVTFEYTGTIKYLEERNPGTGIVTHPESSEWWDWPGISTFTVSVGDTVTGRLSYDTETQLVQTSSQPGSKFFESGYGERYHHSMTLPASGASSTDSDWENIAVRDSSSGRDGIEFSGYSREWDYSLSFSAPRSGFQNALLPGSQALHAFTGDVFSMLQWVGPGYYMADGEITSIRVISSVPEPSTYAMLLVGAVPLLLRRRKA